MILTIDIGNTNINFAVFNKDKIVFNFKSETSKNLVRFDLFSFRKALKKKEISKEQIKAAIICSVVPKANKVFKKALQSFLRIKPLVVGEDIKVPINNKYKKPSQVGQDRLVAAYAASNLYGKPAIVVDFGTAITLDVVSKKGDYLGGIIIPGIEMGLEALYQKTALLPRVVAGKPHELIGRNTKDSILSGAYYGASCMITGLTKMLSKKQSQNAKVVFTGGTARILLKTTSLKPALDENLILKGLQLLYINEVRWNFY